MYVFIDDSSLTFDNVYFGDHGDQTVCSIQELIIEAANKIGLNKFKNVNRNIIDDPKRYLI